MDLQKSLLLFPTLIPLNGVGTYFHVVIKIRQLFLRPAACLTSTLLETGVGAPANAAGNNGLTAFRPDLQKKY
jgi:hypothetical protein